MNRRSILSGAVALPACYAVQQLRRVPSLAEAAATEHTVWVRVWHNPAAQWPGPLPTPGVYRLDLGAYSRPDPLLEASTLFFIVDGGARVVVPRCCIEGMSPLGVNLQVGDTIEVSVRAWCVDSGPAYRKSLTVLERRENVGFSVDEGVYAYRLDAPRWPSSWVTDAMLAIYADARSPSYMVI